MTDETTKEMPEYYIDSFRMSSGAFGVAVTLGVRPPHPEPAHPAGPKEVAVIRMSLEHAKVMAMIMRRTLKDYERGTGSPINLPQKLCNEMGLSLEDW